MSTTEADDPVTTAKPRRAMSLPVVAVLACAILLSLLGLQLALKLPGGQGIEDLLGWTHPEAVAAALSHWRGLSMLPPGSPAPQRWHVEAAYLLVDTGLFMPVYAVLLLMGAHALHTELQSDDALPGRSELGDWLRRGYFTATAVGVALLLVVDAVENHGGAVRIGVPGWLFSGCLVAGAVFGVAMWTAATHARVEVRRAAWWWLVLAFVVGALLVGRGFFGALEAGGCARLDAAEVCQSWGRSAHRAKPWLVTAVVGLLAGAWLLWLFGADRESDEFFRQDRSIVRAQRAALRSGMAAIVWRTRYVLLALAAYAALTLGLDQCRDVLLALARWAPDTADATAAPGWQRAGMVGMVAVSVALLVYSTWLWARLACRVRRQRDVGARAPDAAAALVQARLGVFARQWARALSLLPLACIYALVALTISDATNAASALSDDGSLRGDLGLTVLMLCLIGFVAVGLGAAFLVLRRAMALTHDADYFNQAMNLNRLLTGKDETRRQPLPHGLQRMVDALAWVNPRSLPLLALGGVVLLRFGLAWDPMAMSRMPAALALVTLSLVWWMGVGGALTLVEVRHGRPYGLFLVAAIGLLTLLPIGLADNHLLPVMLPPAGEAALAAQRMQGLFVVSGLATVVGLLWWLLTAELADWRVPAPWRPALRGGALIAALFVALFSLRLADHAEMPAPKVGEVAAARPLPMKVDSLDTAVASWLAQLPDAASPDSPAEKGDVFLVASEGGGIRSAYWTALVLLELRARYPDFDRRSFALSGVSGGAIGIAAYSACLRASGGDGVAACVQRGFGNVDPLSPLLSAWLFEDVLARVLPVPMATDGRRGWLKCSQPACGYLSRVQGFEREWMRALPAMAQPLSAVGGDDGRWEPHLLLNSTWVESGELASAASLRVDYHQFPGARDVQARLGRELNLIGGAHVAARFPFINPLAALQPASGAARASLRGPAPGDLPVQGLDGHLADGGYFDNSAVVALTPVWRRVSAALSQQGWKRRLVVVMIRNGQKPPACEQPDARGPEKRCILPPRLALSLPADLAHPTLRRNWGLYVDALGPLVAVLNVSGIGAHGRHAAADLLAAADQAARAGALTRVMPIDQLTNGALLPLGWYLSPTAREVLKAQAGCLKLELNGSSAARPTHCR